MSTIRKITDQTWAIGIDFGLGEVDVELTVTPEGIQIEYDEVIPWSDIDAARATARKVTDD